MISIIQSGHKISTQHLELAKKSLAQFKNRKDVGFLEIPDRAHLWHEALVLAQRLNKSFTDLVLVGVGGSSLGVRVLREVFSLKRLHFIDNVDAFEFERTLAALPLEKSLFVFVSKSGTTIETLTALEFIHIQFKKQNLDLPKHSVVITENKSSSLKAWAGQHHVPSLEIPMDVGGRFSVLTSVGMFPAAFFNLDIEAFRDGARSAISAESEIAEMMAQSMMSWQREEWIFSLWSYSNRMRFFGGWLQQLWAESLAKKINRDGGEAPRVSTPVPLIGASDQHSILQQVMEGAKDKFVVFHRFSDAEKGSFKLGPSLFAETASLQNKTMGELLGAEAEATQESLAANGISTMTLMTKVLDERSLGFLFMFWQLTVAGLGEALNIDAFNQPGVELGKVLAKQKLNRDL